MTKQVQNRFGDTALDFLIGDIKFELAMLDRDELHRMKTLKDFLEMIEEAQKSFEHTLQVDPDPMLDPQLG